MFLLLLQNNAAHVWNSPASKQRRHSNVRVNRGERADVSQKEKKKKDKAICVGRLLG